MLKNPLHGIVLAASISESEEIKKVLEIGTHSGRFAHFLANIFNDAEIHTIELPEDHQFT